MYSIAEKPAAAPHHAHPEGCAALRIVLVTVPRVSRSCEHFLDGFDFMRKSFTREPSTPGHPQPRCVHTWRPCWQYKGYLADKKQPSPLDPPQDPSFSPTAGS